MTELKVTSVRPTILRQKQIGAPEQKVRLFAIQEVGHLERATTAKKDARAVVHRGIVILAGTEDLVVLLKKATITAKNGALPVAHQGKAASAKSGDLALDRRRKPAATKNLAQPAARRRKDHWRKNDDRAVHTPRRKSARSRSPQKNTYVCRRWLASFRRSELSA
jgi:hypothetical protein